MIITKTPFRMSFFGGGTDIEEYFKKHKGAVISTTFDKYVYVTVRHLPRFFEYTSEIDYSIHERVKSIDEIKHPMVRNAMKYLDMHELRIAYDADLPARTGLGTSSTFAVGLLNAFYSLKGKRVSKNKLAYDAIHVERELCNESGGWQDQIAASFGGLNRIDFNEKGYTVTPIKITKKRKKELNKNLLLFFTGFTRFSAEIQKETTKSLDEKNNELAIIKSHVDRAQNILEDSSRSLDDFGLLLNDTWLLKKRLSNGISNSSIDELYKIGINAGALGGKLLGAGGGGFLLFYVPIEKQEQVRKSLNFLLEVPFQFEDKGTEIIYYNPEEYDHRESLEK